MGVKAVVMCLLILGVVVAEIEGSWSCCRTTSGRNCFESCRRLSPTISQCARRCDCIFISSGSTCPPSHPRGMLESSASGSDYCKLGCTASVCDTIISGLNSGVAEEEVKQAVEHCKNACSQLCNNGDKVELPILDA